MRDSATRAERTLWRRLRARQLLGVKFRRQHPVGPFVVDFVAVEGNLVVELDGGQHAMDGLKARDVERTREIECLGFRVLRFWNGDVLRNPDGVLQVIARSLKAEGTPSP